MMLRQLKIATTQAHAESISDLLLLLDAVSVSFEDAHDQPIYEPPPGATPLWDAVNVVALLDCNIAIQPLVQFIEEKLALSETLHYQSELLIDKDWENAWKQHFHARCFGKKLWICPTHEDVPDSEAIKVLLAPGLAFGTGTHPTTALCLTWLAEQIQDGETVIDFGCGSGILAIAALKLGAQQAYAIDNDPQALTACHENAVRNQLALERVFILPPEKMPTIQADIVIANILANPLIALANYLSTLVKAQGKIILSGILQEQAEAVIAAYQPWCTLESQVNQEGWVRLDLIKH